MFHSDSQPLKDLKKGLVDKTGYCSLVQVWSLLDCTSPLVKLVQHILSFVPNSASTERLFSIIEGIKRKDQSWLKYQKTCNVALNKIKLCQQHIEKRLIRERLKCQFEAMYLYCSFLPLGLINKKLLTTQNRRWNLRAHLILKMMTILVRKL